MNKDKTKPFFSIITVCYNSEKTIARTIKSVLEQTYKDYEYIIIDGSSLDKTFEIVNSYSSKFLGKLQVISEPDQGIYDAINKGINLAKGRVIGIVNSDDWYEKETLEIVAAHYEPSDDCILYGLLRYLRGGKEFMILSYNHEFLHERMINHPTCFVPKNIYKKVGTYELKYQLAADYDFLLKCKEKGFKFRHLPFILSNMSMEGNSKEYHNKSRMETYNILHKHKYISNTNRLLRIIDIHLRYWVKKLFSF